MKDFAEVTRLQRAWEKQKRRDRIENQVLTILISFLSGAIFGLFWAWMQK